MIDAESSPMFRHILLATDGSQQAERAVTHALALAKSLGAKVTAVTATDMMPTGPYAPIPWPSGIDRYEAAAAASANLILNRVVAAAETQDVVCEARHVADQPRSRSDHCHGGTAGLRSDRHGSVRPARLGETYAG